MFIYKINFESSLFRNKILPTTGGVEYKGFDGIIF